MTCGQGWKNSKSPTASQLDATNLLKCSLAGASIDFNTRANERCCAHNFLARAGADLGQAVEHTCVI